MLDWIDPHRGRWILAIGLALTAACAGEVAAAASPPLDDGGCFRGPTGFPWPTLVWGLTASAALIALPSLLMAPPRRWPALVTSGFIGVFEVLGYWRALRGIALAAAVLVIDLAIGLRGFEEMLRAWPGPLVLFLCVWREHRGRANERWLRGLGWHLLEERDVERPTAIFVRLAMLAATAAGSVALAPSPAARFLVVVTAAFAAALAAWCAARSVSLAKRLRHARSSPGVDPRAPALLPGPLDALLLDEGATPYRGARVLGRVPLGLAGPRRARALALVSVIAAMLAAGALGSALTP